MEPTSIRHLDADSDSPRDYPLHMLTRRVEVDVEKTCEIQKKFVGKKGMTRHASLEGDDPGFIGPVVWNRHCQRINESETGTHHICEILRFLIFKKYSPLILLVFYKKYKILFMWKVLNNFYVT